MPAKVTRQLWLTNNRPGEIVESEAIETISTKTYFYLSVFFFIFCKFVQFKKCSYRYRTSLTCFEVHKILKISFLAVQVFVFFCHIACLTVHVKRIFLSGFTQGALFQFFTYSRKSRNTDTFHSVYFCIFSLKTCYQCQACPLELKFRFNIPNKKNSLIKKAIMRSILKSFCQGVLQENLIIIFFHLDNASIETETSSKRGVILLGKKTLFYMSL